MKEKFITAYCYCYGATKSQARKIYEIASQGFIEAVIESFEQDAKASAYND